MRPIDADALVEEITKIDDLRKLNTATIGRAIHSVPTLDIVQVVHCKDCQHCRLLNDGVSFECTSWEMDFYAPEYSAATYYCADGKRREEHGDKASDGE